MATRPRVGISSGRNLFADALVTRVPDLPVDDERQLADPLRRRRFVDRVLAYHRHIR